jgi:putative selenium metabolism hydrolase
VFTLSSQDRAALNAFLQDLVSTASHSCQEGAVARRMAEEMQRVGFYSVWTDRIGNVIGHIGSGNGPRLFLEGHMDTVGVGTISSWTRDPYGATIENGVLYGLGAVDMKGALAAMVYAGKALVDAGIRPQGDLYVVGVVQEEPTEGLALRALVEEEGLRPDFVILGEPSNCQISRGQRGRMEMEVTVWGRSCHASAPERGQNAIYGAARLIFGLEILTAQLGSDPFLGPGCLAVTHIESVAGSKNMIPDLCRFIVDRRLTLGETEGRALAEVQAIIAREGLKAEVAVSEFQVTSYTGYQAQGREYYPAWVVPEDHPFVQVLVRAVQRELGYRPQIGQWGFSTDGVYSMGIAGIPTLGFGPGEERYTHTVDEQIRLTDVYQAAQVYARLAVELLGTAYSP